MKTFKTLELAIEFYGMSEKSDIKGNLRDQLLRAASSISLNLSEGNAKSPLETSDDFSRWLMALFVSAKRSSKGLGH